MVVLVKILFYVLVSSMGLIFLKIGTGMDFGISFSRDVVSFQINHMLILGLLFYAASFCISLLIMKDSDLSIFYPVSAGLAQVCVCLLSYIVLKEKISGMHLLGICLILCGVVIMNIRQ